MTYHAIARDVAPETCPLIDGVIRAIRGAIKTADKGAGCLEDEKAVSFLEDVEFELRGLEDDMETIRKHNRALRDALCAALERVDELEKEKA